MFGTEQNGLAKAHAHPACIPAHGKLHATVDNRPMPAMKDITHSPEARSWVQSANAADTDFPIQNLPLGRFRHNPMEPWQIGVAIGDRVLDLYATGLIDHNDMPRLLAAPAEERHALRLALCQGLAEGSALQKMWADALLWQTEVELGLPCEVGEFICWEPGSPLAPVAASGRAATVGASGQHFQRPKGLRSEPGSGVRERAGDISATQILAFQQCFGAWARTDIAQSAPVSIADAERCLAGITLINDWCARDLGPAALDARGFATTTSPWLVTLEALAPFRVPHAGHSPAHLDSAVNRARGALSVQIEVWLQTAAMRAAGKAGVRIARTDHSRLDWTLAQLVAQLTLNGSPLRTGDLLGTAGLALGAGQGMQDQAIDAQSECVQDGDTIILRGFCAAAGARRIGFGECRGTVLPAVACPRA